MSEEKAQSGAPDFNKLEEEVLQFWDEGKIFEKSLEQTKDGESYVFYDGPPFATGLPHHGHILGSTVKDAFGRYQTMQGKYVRRVWGWDCHGLPIENIVEKNLKISGKKQIETLGVEKFNEACRKQVLEFADEWGKMVRRMGRWVEFEKSYKTMDTTYQESVWWALKQFWDKGLVYEDRKVLLYCSRCETPISNFEVAMDNSYRDITENSVFVKFRLLERQRILDWISDDKTFVLAWTTTPWTLPGNTALNIGRDITYVLVKPAQSEEGAEKFILAKDRLEVLEGEVEIIMEFSARSLEGLQYEPLYKDVLANQTNLNQEELGRAHKIYIEDYVTTTDGTGVVHNAAMYGEEDFLAAKNRGLPRVDMLDQKGEYLDIAPEFLRGKFFKDADSLVLQDLSQRGLVYKLLPFMHSYPHCYRCATPLFYNALPAWFINIQKLKPELLAQNQQVNWYPEHLKTGRFANSVEGAPDWNISRNRFWATALPFWKCQDKNCGQVTCVGSVVELKSKARNFSEVYPQVAGINFPLPVAGESIDSFSEDEAYEKLDLHKPYIDMVVLTCEKCGKPMQRVPEVVDCWVESGSMPFAELHAPFENEQEFKARFPADFVSEYIAQTRAWFYVMHVVGVGVFGRAPFRNVVTTGNILAEDGSKMSKSLKNYPDPWLVIEKYGIDALRFYLLSTPVMNGDDLNFSEKGLKDVYQKLNMLLFNVWQFYRMYESKSSGADFSEIPKVKQVLDVWILERVKQLTFEVTKAMDSYQTPKACRALLDFISDLSTWYVRRSRDRMKTEGVDAANAVDTLGYVLTRVSILLAPLAPFLSENIFKSITGGESVHLVRWPHEEGRDSAFVADEKVLSQMAVVREICSMALAARKKVGVSVRQPLQALGFELKDQNIRLSVDHFDVILEELNVKEVKDVESLSELFQRRGSMEEVEGQGVVTKILLDLELNEALIREGHTRELERAVQDLRKKAGLKPGDEVTLYYNTQDEQLESLLLEQLDRKKTSVKEIAKEVEVEADEEVQSEVGGKAVWLGILKS